MKKEILITPRKGLYVPFFILIGMILLLLGNILICLFTGNYHHIFGKSILILCDTLLIYYISLSLTTIRISNNGCIIKRGRKKQFHAWNEFRIIYHYRIKEKTHFNGDLFDVILLSTIELKNRKAKRGTLSYLFFKDKFNVLCIELYTKEKIRRNVGKFDTIWYEREEFLETLGQWGIKIESDCEDLNKYYIPKQEEKTVELVDGIGIKKLQENQWKIVTTLFEHIILYDDNKKELFIDGIRRRFSEKAVVRFIGIDEGIEIDGKKIRIVVRNKKCELYIKGNMLISMSRIFP